MKLPDYLKCVEIQELLIKMGVKEIPELKPATFTREVVETRVVEVENDLQLNFGRRLERESVPMSEADSVKVGADGTIEVNGIKACAYIKKQRRGIDHRRKTSISYRYHLCNCKTIDEKIARGHLYKYVSTTRSDGIFPVIDLSGDRAREIELRLELCSNCRELLLQRGMLTTPYSLKEFFRRFQPEIPKTIRKTEQVVVEEMYAPDHDEIAKRYKEQVGYVCQLCSVDCSSHKQCLHLHHKDGNGQNNLAANLHVLCTDCHTLEHPHMVNNPHFKQQRQIITRLRRDQGITELNS
ncbi:HNH endonuclease signature motif containing protein [uncultured Pseudodesulfovibrio sp.]|uniref:HNH endonuclease signature motif containing protein n=1 Tax=uncultured Pseudodesulfovibrio sp. TaxID=2035858 RepID=UPI0029C987CF|nr:HNH endonuclease signature motif containing protein [uncultured Pseudodesulfovibrio sp.]